MTSDDAYGVFPQGVFNIELFKDFRDDAFRIIKLERMRDQYIYHSSTYARTGLPYGKPTETREYNTNYTVIQGQNLRLARKCTETQ